MTEDVSIDDATFVVVDVETTGMSPVEDRITEIAMMKVKRATLVEEFSTLVNPLVTIPASIMSLTGIDNLMVRDAPTAREVVPFVSEFLQDTIFTAHNAAFDWGFVSHTARRERGVELANPQICTVKLARKILPSLSSKSLDHVTRFLEIKIPDRHRASGDAYATALVLLKFLSFLKKKHNLQTLDELMRFQNGN